MGDWDLGWVYLTALLLGKILGNLVIMKSRYCLADIAINVKNFFLCEPGLNLFVHQVQHMATGAILE